MKKNVKNIGKLTLYLALFMLSATHSFARMGDNLPKTEAEIMGTLAGAAWACNAGESLINFEIIAGNILLNKAKTRKAQERAIDEYALAKLNAYKAQKRNPKVSCRNVIARFEAQEIFQSTVLADGRVRLPDGSWLIPHKYLNGQEILEEQ